VVAHDRVIAAYGGRSGLRDMSLLESAVGGVEAWAGYNPDASLPRIAARLCIAVIRNHAFLDGNKRCGWIAVQLTLVMNGIGLKAEADKDGLVDCIVGIASGREAAEAELGDWIRRSTTRDHVHEALFRFDSSSRVADV